MAIPTEAELAETLTDHLKDVSSDFNDQGSDVHDVFQDGLGLALARTLLELLDGLELSIVAGEMTGADSAGDTPDTLTGPVVIE